MDRLVPPVDELTAPYWEACQRGELHLQQCRSCSQFIHLPEPECPWCTSTDLTYTPVSGRGQVETFSVVHRTFAPGFTARVPYVLAWVALEEQTGLRAFGNISGCDPLDVHIGLPVRVEFEVIPGFGSIPNFSAT